MNKGQQQTEQGAAGGPDAPGARTSRLGVTIHATAEEACRAVAQELTELILGKPASTLGLATGSTMVGVYGALVDALGARRVALDGLQTFNLDEYLGLPIGSPASFRAFMDAHLFGPCGFADHQVAFPAAAGGEASSASLTRGFEAAIDEAGGLDLQLLGLGRNGHIAFNEPGSRPDSRTREVELAPKTRADAAAAFGSLDAVPRRAVTMGVGTILEARRIRVVALGEHKAEIVARLVAGADGAEVPACYLTGHPDVRLHVDAAAGSRLSAD